MNSKPSIEWRNALCLVGVVVMYKFHLLLYKVGIVIAMNSYQVKWFRFAWTQFENKMRQQLEIDCQAKPYTYHIEYYACVVHD